jgi:hypothetical protein
MVDALTAKNTEIESLAKSLDSWKKKAAASEQMLASLQVSSFILLSFFNLFYNITTITKGSRTLCHHVQL